MHWFRFQGSRITAKKRTWETLGKMFSVQSLSGTGETRVPRVDISGEEGFLRPTSPLIPFRCGPLYKASLQLSSCFPSSPPHQSPFLSPSQLRKCSACLHLRAFFFKAIDPQPSAPINSPSSVCSVGQTTPPPSPEFTLGLHFIIDAEDNQYELGGWCWVKKHNLPKHTILFVSAKNCWPYILKQ